MSDDLKKARVLAGALQSREMIKIHPRQCETLRDKLMETMDLVEKEKAIKASCGKVYHELLLVVHRVKIFIDDCCYKRDGDFVLAAIKVAAHKERFIKYYVELDWCIFLVKCLKDAKGESVSSETLEGFEWKKKVDSLVRDTKSKVEKDFSDLKDLLRQSVKRRGDHQKICLTLLRRFSDETGIDHSVPDDVELSGVPPFESTGERIGIGGFGEVYSLKWKKKMFAVKIPLSTAKTLDKEVAILEKCGHPNIVNLILFHKKPDGKEYLMMEKLSCNLVEYIKTVEEGLPPPLLKGVDMILQVCEGLQYLSEKHHVSHRDLKPLNILVKLEGGQQDPVLELQVADFGLAKVRAALEMSSKNTPNVGTTVYRAPEMTGAAGPGTDKIREESLKADMYSFAVTCSYILTGSEPYKNIRREDLRKSVLEEGVRPRLPEDCPPELSSLLAQCWHSEPSKRPASFSEISEKLRKLKAKLLTCDVHEGDESGSSSRENGRITFNSGDRPLRILVLGNSDAVDAAFISICGNPGHAMEDHVFLKESMSASPAVCLYRGRRTSEYDSGDFADIMAFVKERNKPWHQETVMAAWRKDLYEPPSERALFPNSNMRLHMVWYVCTRVGDLPNTLQWDDITKKLKGLPVRILVTEANQYDRILQYSYRFFEKDQKLEDPNLIIKIDLKDDAAKRRLWQTCWEVKSGAEIKNAATVLWAIRKELGPNGIIIPVGVAAKKHKAFSVKRSKEFTLTFLCTYWDVPEDFFDVLVGRIRTQQTSNFVSFCLQNAAAILYREHEHVHGLVPELSFEAYFQNLDLSACDNWKSRDIQAFLEAVFQGKDPPCPLVGGLDRSSSFAKCIELLCGKGRVR